MASRRSEPTRAPWRSSSAKALSAARKLGKTNAPDNTVLLGAADRSGVESFGMLPERLTVPVGTTVNFAMWSRPSRSTRPRSAPVTPRRSRSPTWGSSPRRSRAPEFDRRATYPSDPPGTTASLTPALHGNGFWNSGLLDAVRSPLPASGGDVRPGGHLHVLLRDPHVHEGDGHRPVTSGPRWQSSWRAGAAAAVAAPAASAAVREYWVAASPATTGTWSPTSATRSPGWS